VQNYRIVFTLDLKDQYGSIQILTMLQMISIILRVLVGLSATAPIVAGVAALIKSVNHCLTVKEIYEIIITTANRVGNYDFSYVKSLVRAYGTLRYR
jgi:hypothetical protein